MKVVVEYQPKDLKRASVTVSQSSREIERFPVVKESALGRHVVYFRPWDWMSWEARARKAAAPEDSAEIRAMITKGSWGFRRVLQKGIDLYVLGKELVSPWG